MHTCLSQMGCSPASRPRRAAAGLGGRCGPPGREVIQRSLSLSLPNSHPPWFRSTQSPRIHLYLKLKLKFFNRLNLSLSWEKFQFKQLCITLWQVHLSDSGSTTY